MNTKVISEGYVVNATDTTFYYNRQSGYVTGNPTVYASLGAAMKVASKQAGTVRKCVVVVVHDPVEEEKAKWSVEDGVPF